MSDTKFSLDAIDLPKWPALVVRGEPVTREQSAEIIVRTERWHSDFGNSKEWSREVMAIAEIKMDPDPRWVRPDYADADRFCREHGVIELEYLVNRQIGTAYLGDGPHGWCNWAGEIGCDSYNIGKWPIADAVFEEWREISEAFPFLTLWCQLYSGERCEEGIRPLVEYRVAGGNVEACAPVDRGVAPFREFIFDEVAFVATLNDPMCRHERGCTAEQLREAIRIVRERRQWATTPDTRSIVTPR